MPSDRTTSAPMTSERRRDQDGRAHGDRELVGPEPLRGDPGRVGTRAEKGGVPERGHPRPTDQEIE